MTPDVIYDQLIGAGCARKLIFSWGGNPGVGSLHRFRDAVESGWPQPLEIEEHSHAGMANRYVAGASGLPFAVLRGYSGHRAGRPDRHDQADHLPVHRRDADRGRRAQPRRGDHPRAAGRPRRERAVLGHRRRAEGSGARRRSGPSSPLRRSLTTLDPRPRAVVLARLGGQLRRPRPRRRAPVVRAGYSDRDNDYYVAWDEITRDRESFRPGWTSTSTTRSSGGRTRPWGIQREPAGTYTADEMMTVAAARALRTASPASSGSGCRARRPTWPAPRTRRTWSSSTSRARSAPSRTGCRCPSATASWPRPPTP